MGYSELFEFPAVNNLPTVENLPDPFLMPDGSRVSGEADWENQRRYITEMLLHYQYGHMPPFSGKIRSEEISRKKILGGKAVEAIEELRIGPDNPLVVRISYVKPKGSGPFPVIIKNDRQLGQVPVRSEIVDRGYMVVEYIRHDLDEDDGDRSDGVHPLYPDYDWGTLAAWAWGAMRVIDYLAPLDFIDEDRIVFTGHSRGGKTALLAGALDERIALTVPNGSGTGGAGGYRIQGEGAESLEDIVDRFSYWFHPRLGQFIGKEDKLPFDQHFLRALVAPRAVLSTDALGDSWANPLGTQEVFRASQVVFDWLGVGQKNALHFREGGHEHSSKDWYALLDFADYLFQGKDEDRPSEFNRLPFPERSSFDWSAPE